MADRRHSSVTSILAAACAVAITSSLPLVTAASAADGAHDTSQDQGAQQLAQHRAPGSLAAWVDDAGALRQDSPSGRVLEAVGTSTSPVDATAQLVEAAWGVRPNDTRQAAEAGASMLRTAVPAGDLDSGQGTDVVVVEASFASVLAPQTTRLRAINGSTGDVRWVVDLAAAPAVPPLSVPDVTGDGADDLLVLGFTPDRTSVEWCGSTQCVYGHAQQHSWSMTMVSGRDGSTVWSHTYDGQMAWGGAGANLFPPGLITSDSATVVTKAIVLPLLSDDHDGDGAPDLVVNVVDVVRPFDYQWTNYGNAGASLPTTATASTLLSGRSGSPLMQRSQAWTTGGEAVLSPVGDAVGSAVGDLLWQARANTETPQVCHTEIGDGCVEDGLMEMDLEMVDGTTLEPRWQRTVGGGPLVDGFVTAADADLNGDARSDLVLWSASDHGGERWVWSMAGWDGSGGTQLWRRDQQSHPDSIDGTAIGSTGGAPGGDLLVLDLELRLGLQQFDSYLHRVDGATGQSLGSSHRSSLYLNVLPTRDTDGDAVGDLLVNTGWFNPDQRPVFRWSGEVESGASKAIVYSRSTPTSQVRLLQPAGDVDGDGRDEVLDVVLTNRVDEPTTLGFVSLATGHAVWGRAYELSDVVLTVVDDAFRERAALLVTRTTYRADDGIYLSTVESLDAGLQGLAWRVGSDLADEAVYPLMTSRVSFTQRSATTAQHTDSILLEAHLVTEAGDPVTNVPVTFELGASHVEVVTDASGFARAAMRVDALPGNRELSARFGGHPYEVAASSESAAFHVGEEDTFLSLTILPGQAEVLARLADADDLSAGISGRTVAFLVDGRPVGGAVTGSDGQARLVIPARYRRGTHSYVAEFAGDLVFVASSGTARVS